MIYLQAIYLQVMISDIYGYNIVFMKSDLIFHMKVILMYIIIHILEFEQHIQCFKLK